MAPHYTLASVSRRTPAGTIIADRYFLEAQALLSEAFPDHGLALFRAFNSRNAALWEYRNGHTVGAAITSHPVPTEGELHFFAIAPPLQGTGLGRAFYEALEPRAFPTQSKIVAVTPVPAFFEKLGFFDRSPARQRTTERYMIKVK
jgi:GNAT superfamily N-acetyltransferase